MTLKYFNFSIATEENETICDLGFLFKNIPRPVLKLVRKARNENKTYIQIPENLSFNFRNENVLEIQWG